ncbi:MULTISPECIES: cupredoxin domain-containing protein [Brevibacillus]|uniref:EfeO-type cupredoxin-like domain-containing protein n=1 Tax=Brevibacillus brevis (strain 47 / JCM 6285 / NBRC 100599) TaxID=358681 RepID=C0ZKR2_BREBN|nr:MULTISPECIES: cupredoxin domain-containing protein [Brevibacillus]MBH0328605.1 quinol oxidase [Brevibacillus brevis]NRR04121.1 cupredoxin domain-containing protein [Brevibacillus sp. RS1.1]NRS48152.1 cupredoxin domain-containing protein [Brevibacillus sp. HB2.2]OUQ89330.1 quinol oxidase [Brevibacillus brevis]UIO41567.1 cupredoxin domain-containing protein [Brevibacillus brevis]
MNKKWGLLISSVALSAMLMTACGGDKEQAASTDAAATTGTQVNIEASNWKFNQETYEVKAGEEFTLNFKSTEGFHGIGIQGLDVDLQKDGSKTMKIDAAGEYTIFCNVICGPDHGKMVAKLVVK